MNAVSLAAALLMARNRLAQALGLAIDVAGLEAQVLLAHALNQPRVYLLSHSEAIISGPAQAQFESLLARREYGEPIAYLLGQREFYGLDFRVTPDVLIPRPETELLVELSLAQIPLDTPSHILDLGTGSGAIGVTLAKLRPRAHVTAVDASPKALAIARENASRIGVSNIRFVESDWFGALNDSSCYDLIVANPPYVAEGDPHLSQGDVRFEPIIALTSGADGLNAIHHIARESQRFLKVGGRLLFEHGYDQKAACHDLLQSLGYADIACHTDLGEQPRITGGSKR